MSESADPSNASRYFRLGLFMLIGSALIATGAILLGAGALFRKTIPAETLVYESVNGLDVGAAVKYRGVPIGKVTGVVFASVKYPQAAAEGDAPDGGREVRGILIEMALNEKAFPGEKERQIVETARRLVTRGLRARVTPVGISGQSYVDCDILNPADHPPPPITWTPDVLYVPSAPSSIGQVLDSAGQIASDLQKANLGRVVGHIDDLTAQATATFGNVNRLVDANREHLNRTLAELPETAVRLRETVTRADQILHDPRVEKAIAGLSAAAEAAPAAVADLRRLARDARQLLAGESDDLRSILTDLRRLAADGAAVAADARQNPSRLLFGRPPPADPRATPPPSRR